MALRRVATEAEYERIFEPRDGAGPSGLADRPRPFVFRAPVEFFPLRLDLTARDALYFAPGKAANILRGAFGIALRRVATATEYEHIFEPRGGAGPSGLADRPRPFVLRARHLEDASVPAGGNFHFQVNIFDAAICATVTRAFYEALREGIGPGRGRAEPRGSSGGRVSIDLQASAAPSQIRVDFLTPTELKHEQRLVEQPEFAALFARVRDRIGALRAFYGAGPLEIDFATIGARAATVRMTRCEIRAVEAQRRSSRTGQTHPIGGFTGLAEYVGPLAEFLPYLDAAQWTGVGRQAVWGKGEIAVSCIM